MFSSSVRRVAFTTPQTPIASLASSVPRAASHATYRSHQRRFSSSKPSSPADGSKGVAKGQAIAGASPVEGSKEGKAGDSKSEPQDKKALAEDKKSQRAGKRKTCATKGRDKIVQNLPSVPSTHHIPANKLAASDFFSLHRPISITHNFPQAVTEETFASIFTPRMKANPKPQDVISTLSSAVQNIESVTGKMKSFSLGPQQQQWNADTDELRAAITAESYKTAEVQQSQQEATMEFPHHILSGRYQPFHPPPPPVPMNTVDSLAAGAEAAGTHEPQHRIYTAVLTMEEFTDTNGEVTYSAHSSPLQEDAPMPARFLGRMQIRQERSRERATGSGMWAISVKRQRKLKMKKHKYKKLMRRTRNLRRKLDRT